jgi:hypothetical protein
MAAATRLIPALLLGWAFLLGFGLRAPSVPSASPARPDLRTPRAPVVSVARRPAGASAAADLRRGGAPASAPERDRTDAAPGGPLPAGTRPGLPPLLPLADARPDVGPWAGLARAPAGTGPPRAPPSPSN